MPPQAPRAPERGADPLVAEEQEALRAVAAAEERLEHIRRVARERAAFQFHDVRGRDAMADRAEPLNEEQERQAAGTQALTEGAAIEPEIQEELDLLEKTSQHHTMLALEQWKYKKWLPDGSGK